MCAQRRLRSAWASAQSDQSLRCPHEESLGPELPNERTAKTLIRLGGCPGWSESSLGAESFCWFCHEAAQLKFLQCIQLLFYFWVARLWSHPCSIMLCKLCVEYKGPPGGWGYLFPCSPRKNGFVHQKTNSWFSMCPCSPKLPVFPLFLGLCSPVPLKKMPLFPCSPNPWEGLNIHILTRAKYFGWTRVGMYFYKK